MNSIERCLLILHGFNCSYVSEWQDVYNLLFAYIYHIYQKCLKNLKDFYKENMLEFEFRRHNNTKIIRRYLKVSTTIINNVNIMYVCVTFHIFIWNVLMLSFYNYGEIKTYNTMKFESSWITCRSQSSCRIIDNIISSCWPGV